MLYVMILAIGACGAAYVVVPLLAKVVMRQRFCRSVADADCAFLTFDDGPDPVVTPQVLAVLSRFDAKATFFVIGEKAQRHPELIARLVAEGHEVGEHSYRHLNAWKFGSVTIARDLARASAVLDALGVRRDGRMLRPPFGKLNAGSLAYILRARRPVAYWTVDPQDFRRNTGAEVAALVSAKLTKGSVVLLHDGAGRKEEDSATPVVVAALERILRDARDRKVPFSVLRMAPLSRQSSAVRHARPEGHQENAFLHRIRL